MCKQSRFYWLCLHFLLISYGFVASGSGAQTLNKSRYGFANKQNDLDWIQMRNQKMLNRIQLHNQGVKNVNSSDFFNTQFKQFDMMFRLQNQQQLVQMQQQDGMLRLQAQQQRIQVQQREMMFKLQNMQQRIQSQQREMIFRLQMQQQRIQDQQREMMFKLQTQMQRIQDQQRDMAFRLQTQLQKTQFQQQNMFLWSHDQQALIRKFDYKMNMGSAIEIMKAGLRSPANTFGVLRPLELLKVYAISRRLWSPLDAPFHLGWSLRLLSYDPFRYNPFRNMRVSYTYRSSGGFRWP